MTEIKHSQLSLSTGIDMHIAEAGSGPAVVFCHGFPELWYSWRHQLPVVAEAGFRAIAPICAATATPTRRPTPRTTPRN